MSEDIQLHPLCTLFPRLEGAEFDSLVDDIRQNGQREPIIIHDGMILDGGNRYRACLAAGVKPDFMRFGGGSIVSYVLSANLHRRHLTPGQTAAIVSSAQDWARAQNHGGNRKIDQAVKLPLETVKDRACLSGVSDKTQRNADKVARASPELALRVAHGEVSLNEAVKKISPKQDQAVTLPLEKDKLTEALGVLRELSEENEQLKDRIAIEAMDFSEEEKSAAKETIESLREQVKNLETELDAVKISRDAYQRENAELKRQCAMYRKKLDDKK